MEDDESLGFLKYEGKLVEEGIIDVHSAIAALDGFHEAIQFFVAQESPRLAVKEMPLPVKIKKGSLAIVIPQDLCEWLAAAAGIAGTAYLAKAASTLAENDFKNVDLKKLIISALKKIQWLIRLGKHLGHINLRIARGIIWDRQDWVGLTNQQGKTLYIPIDDWKRLSQCPLSLLSKMASVIEDQRTLIIGVVAPAGVETEPITSSDKRIFYIEENESDVLFPEFQHGQQVDLVGYVTRGNGNTNSIGFLYNGHILNCKPRIGNIVRFKPHLFETCQIIGEISRDDEKGGTTAPRPTIIFNDLIIIDGDSRQQFLFKRDDIE